MLGTVKGPPRKAINAALDRGDTLRLAELAIAQLRHDADSVDPPLDLTDAAVCVEVRL